MTKALGEREPVFPRDYGYMQMRTISPMCLRVYTNKNQWPHVTSVYENENRCFHVSKAEYKWEPLFPRD